MKSERKPANGKIKLQPGIAVEARGSEKGFGPLVVLPEPVTVAMAVISAIKGILDIINFFSKDKSNESVNSTLEDIVSRLDQIIEALKYLTDYLPVALDNAFRKKLSSEVKAHADAMSFHLAGLTDKEIRNLSVDSQIYADVRQLSSKQLQSTYELRDYGFLGYFAAAMGATSFIAMCAVLRYRKANMEEFRDKMKAFFSSCIDPSNSQSAITVRNKIVANGNASRSAIINFPETVWLGSYSYLAPSDNMLTFLPASFQTLHANLSFREPNEPRDPREPPRPRKRVWMAYYGRLSGKAEDNLVWSLEEVRSDVENPRGLGLIPSESATGLENHRQSAEARLYNNLHGWAGFYGLLNHLRDAQYFEAKSKELQVTIDAIGEVISSIDLAVEKFK